MMLVVYSVSVRHNDPTGTVDDYACSISTTTEKLEGDLMDWLVAIRLPAGAIGASIDGFSATMAPMKMVGGGNR